MEEQWLHPSSLLSCMQCCCVLSVHAPSGWAQRELRAESWCEQSCSTFKPTIEVALRHGNSPGVCIALRGGQVCSDAGGASCAVPGPEEQQGCVVGGRREQLPAAPCGWKGGRYTVRE